MSCISSLSSKLLAQVSRLKAKHTEGMESTWPRLYFNHHCYPHLLRFLLHALLFSMQGELGEVRWWGAQGERSQTTHTDPGLHPPPPKPPVPPPSVHVPLPPTPQQQGPEPLQRSQSISQEGEEREEVSKKRGETEGEWSREGVKGTRGEAKRKWDGMKLNHKKGRVGQRRGTD